MPNVLARFGVVAVLAAFALSACAAPEPPQAEDVSAAIQSADDHFAEAFSAGDAETVASLYTEGAQLLPPNSDFVSGTAAIQGFWQSVMGMGVAQAKLEVVEAESIGDTAWEVGRYTLYSAAGDTIDEGKYIVIWKKTDAGWRLHRDIWNSSRPGTE